MKLFLALLTVVKVDAQRSGQACARAPPYATERPILSLESSPAYLISDTDICPRAAPL